jgi:hypothetical protein
MFMSLHHNAGPNNVIIDDKSLKNVVKFKYLEKTLTN